MREVHNDLMWCHRFYHTSDDSSIIWLKIILASDNTLSNPIETWNTK